MQSTAQWCLDEILAAAIDREPNRALLWQSITRCMGAKQMCIMKNIFVLMQK